MAAGWQLLKNNCCEDYPNSCQRQAVQSKIRNSEKIEWLYQRGFWGSAGRNEKRLSVKRVGMRKILLLCMSSPYHGEIPWCQQNSLPEFAASSCRNAPNKGCFKPELGEYGLCRAPSAVGAQVWVHSSSAVTPGKYCSALGLTWPDWGNQITEHSEDKRGVIMLVTELE